MEESLITFFAMEGLRQELRTIVFPQDPQNMEDLWKSVRMAESAVAPTRSSVQPVAITEVFTSGLKDVVADMGAVMTATWPNSTQGMSHPDTTGHKLLLVRRMETTYVSTVCVSHVLTGLHVRLGILIAKYCNKKGHYAKVCHKRLLSNANIISNSKTSQ